jgi:hypothetical protein
MPRARHNMRNTYPVLGAAHRLLDPVLRAAQYLYRLMIPGGRMPRIGPQIVIIFNEQGDVAGVYTARRRTRVALVYRQGGELHGAHVVGHFEAIRSLRSMPPRDAELLEEHRARPRRRWIARKGNLRRPRWPHGHGRGLQQVLATREPDGQQLPTAMTWAEMLRAEPGLAALRRDTLRRRREWSKGLRGQRPFCAEKIMQEDIAPELAQLVGRSRRRDPLWLCQPAAFNRAYWRLATLLPSCRGCEHATDHYSNEPD